MKQYFEHRDFYLCAYLLMNSCQLISHTRENGVTTFIFNNNEIVQELIEKFYALQGNVDALSYSSAIRSLKSVIHSSNSKSNSKGQIQNGMFNNQKGKL